MSAHKILHRGSLSSETLTAGEQAALQVHSSDWDKTQSTSKYLEPGVDFKLINNVKTL